MGLPGYFIDTIDNLVELPVAERWGDQPLGIEDGTVELETNGGNIYVYEQFNRTIRKVPFRCTAEQIEAFRTLHQTVRGRKIPFYYLADVDNPSDVLYCRKEKSFFPKQLDEPAFIDGEPVAMYDYELTLTGEAEAIDLEA